MTIFLYLLVVVIWGTTWIAIKLQLGSVAIPLSIAYRFGLASLFLFAILACTRRLVRPRGRAALLVVAQGLCLFCLNFLCFYHASRWIPSGLVAVVFSTAPLWNAFNGRVFLGRAVSGRVLAGALLGLCGIAALFSPEWGHTGSHTVAGLLLALGGTLCFSAGNLLSGALQARGWLPVQTNAWAMLVGTLVLLAGSGMSGVPVTMDWSTHYLGALLYLALPGSVIGFTAYLMLVGRLGAERAAYSTVLFPVVSLNISAWLEGYHWTLPALCGLGLVMVGNVLVFSKPRGRRDALAAGTVGKV
ncbi:DMT family transporter [Paludibacterium yongneupense]|uniref:DMT family transporter n=1 Tax=Paludibacterium yongneupense TaxID=400061 RepID=UPI0003FC7079|nr:DMT family transporter [Paludibacterium yongneupense]